MAAKGQLGRYMATLKFFDVDSAVRYAHDYLLECRHRFRASGLDDPVEWLNPATFAELIGLAYEVVPYIDLEDRRPKDAPVGLLDLTRKHVLVSEELGLEVARYTGAHELAHFLLHQRGFEQHFERAVDPTRPRTHREREADQFAARFLMPKKLVRRRCLELLALPKGFEFPINVDDQTLFFLNPNMADLDRKKLDLEFALARIGRDVQNRHIVPLHQQFKVSTQAPAIRLQEIGVFRYPATSYSTDL